ncbi:MAG: hypothetical protein FWG66_12745 [Spirochaetes bacterium]|nr:hypothetical protein [Spirochaetota bacterium]
MHPMQKVFNPISWHEFNFLLTPNEFEAIFKDFRYVDYGYGKALSEDYIETASQKVFDNYRVFYGKLISGYKFDRMKDSHELMWLNMGITGDPLKCSYQKNYFSGTDYAGKVLMDFGEPCVDLNLLTLHFDGKELSSKLAYVTSPEKIIGMSIRYPKEITYFDEENGEIQREETVSCANMETFRYVYKNLVASIEKISGDLIFSKDGTVYKPPIKASCEILANAENIYFLQSNACKIIR